MMKTKRRYMPPALFEELEQSFREALAFERGAREGYRVTVVSPELRPAVEESLRRHQMIVERIRRS